MCKLVSFVHSFEKGVSVSFSVSHDIQNVNDGTDKVGWLAGWARVCFEFVDSSRLNVRDGKGMRPNKISDHLIGRHSI